MQAETFGPIGNRHYAEYVDNIKSSGEVLLNLINVILDISKIEAGKFELQDDDVQLRPFFMNLIKLLSPLADSKSISINCDVPETLPSLRCDSRVLSQIIMNLLSNSIKFTPDNGQIAISAAINDGQSILIKVIDNGPGMSEQEIQKAFEPFSRGDSVKAKKYQGTGLGLHISLLLMKRHGGTIEIQSAPEQGTTVLLTFPPQRTLT